MTSGFEQTRFTYIMLQQDKKLILGIMDLLEALITKSIFIALLLYKRRWFVQAHMTR